MESAFRSLPARVPIHGVVASAQARDDAGPARLDAFERGQRTARWRVAPVQEGVQAHPRALARRQLQQGGDVRVVAVDAAIGDEAEHVQRGAGACLHGGAEHRIGGELAAGDGVVDARQILMHHAPGAERHVADFGVAHLSWRQADAAAGCVQGGSRRTLPEPIPARRGGDVDGVVRRCLADAPAVEHDERGRGFDGGGAGGGCRHGLFGRRIGGVADIL